MTALPGYVPRLAGLRSRAIFHWRATDARLDALSGHPGTLTRAATATGTDVAGLTVTYVNHAPAWTVGADGALRLALGASDLLTWPVYFPNNPRACTLYVALDQAAWGYTVTPGGEIALGGTGPARLVLTSNAANNGNLLGTHHNGTSSVSSNPGAGPAQNTLAEYLLVLTASGAVQLTRIVAGIATAGTLSGGLALAPFAANELRVTAPARLQALKVLAGVRTLTECREAV